MSETVRTSNGYKVIKAKEIKKKKTKKEPKNVPEVQSEAREEAPKDEEKHTISLKTES